ncbi:acyltransferase family protein [Xanthobacter autotrophicus]|uniref:acyltransferase family protein n=1 Tax=Xanthobacter autotrophicus TaxID=280 RepID=UPI0024A61A62|nr:acyltransferase family protein [Xanthobacter autotrophicus]MDI4655899.1 acyltransferase [Xanthobacter autotrophicus]
MGLAYRADVDGLRALAIVPVVLFHIHLSAFPGGYVGVDIFFVISGYLITAILFRDMKAGRFSLLDFYDRRIRRIFPALFVVLVATTLAAVFIMVPSDLLLYARSLRATTLFFSNIYFAKNLNYFQPEADLNPLLHTWSLAVEEQFYIFFPLILFALIRWVRPNLLRPIILVLIVASLAHAEIRLSRNPIESFFSLPTRAWELLIGSALALGLVPLVTPRKGAWLSLAGLALIVCAIAFYDRHTRFPGLAALAPCLGAALILHGGASGAKGIVQRMLASPVPVFFGRISYSLYLWHWPLLVLIGYYLERHLSPTEGLMIAAVSVGLATLSLFYVEAPFRKRHRAGTSRWIPVWAGGAAMALVVAFALTAIARDGRFWPMSAFAQQADALARAQDPYMSWCSAPLSGPMRMPAKPQCVVGRQAAAPSGASGEAALPAFDVLLWGDSHASALMAGLGEAATRADASIRLVMLPACPPLGEVVTLHESIKGLERQCPAFNRGVLELIAEKRPKLVVMAGRWSPWTSLQPGFAIRDGNDRYLSAEEARAEFARGLARSVEGVTRLGIPVVLVGQVPEFGFSPPHCITRAEFSGADTARCLSQDREKTLAGLAASNQVLLDVAKGNPLVTTVLLSDRFCGKENCPAMEAGTLIYRDPNHLSVEGSRAAAGFINLAGILRAAAGGQQAAGQGTGQAPPPAIR